MAMAMAMEMTACQWKSAYNFYARPFQIWLPANQWPG